MRCYYEELGIPREATDTDIKTAYRIQVLRWHPDKNPEMLEEAKKRFLLIQEAYSVLSDQKEKTWYDDHRKEILRGAKPEIIPTFFSYFTQSCYEGYGDDPKSFYSVYNGVFQEIALEDANLMEDSVEISSIPIFGKKDSSYEDVVRPFYAYWQSYSSKITYGWLSPFDDYEKRISDARKKRNEEVRHLVSYIHKRDYRVHLHRMSLERIKLNRQKQREYRMEKRRQDLAALYKLSNDSSDDQLETELEKLDRHYVSNLESKHRGVDDFKFMDEETARVNAIVEKGRKELELSEAQLILDAERSKKKKKSKKRKKNVLKIDSDTDPEEKIDDFLIQQTVDSSDTKDRSRSKKGAKNKKNEKCESICEFLPYSSISYVIWIR